MSDFLPPLPPLMSPERARDIARILQASSVRLAQLGAVGEARLSMQQAQWWLNYALVLGRGGESAPEPPAA